MSHVQDSAGVSHLVAEWLANMFNRAFAPVPQYNANGPERYSKTPGRYRNRGHRRGYRGADEIVRPNIFAGSTRGVENVVARSAGR